MENSEAWTARIDPGLATYSDHPERVYEHLLPLIDFAKMTLAGREKEFGDYPIYLKATGGMRELPFQKREEILTYVRKYLSNKEFCPFFFREDFARIISGELSCLQMDYIYLVCNVCMYVCMYEYTCFFVLKARKKQYFRGQRPTSLWVACFPRRKESV